MSSCVNLSHPDIKKLVEQTGFHPLEIATMVSRWQDENDTDEFPRARDINGPAKIQDYYTKYGTSKSWDWNSRQETKKALEKEFPGLTFLINGPHYGMAKFQPEIDRQYQESNQGLKKIDKNIDEKIKKFLQSIGVTYINTDNILDVNGNKLSAVAVSEMMAKVIQVVEGKADITTLSEEAAHFFVAMLKDNQFLEKMISDIDQYSVYKEVLSSAFYQEQYKGDDRKMRIEAVGKQIVKSIIKKQAEENKLLDSKFNRFWNNIWDKIKAAFSKADPIAKKSLYDIVGDDIMSNNIEKLDVNKELKDESFYQSNEEQSKVVNNLDNKFSISYNENLTNSKTNKKGVYELVKDGVVTPIFNRVSDVVEAINKKRGFAERTEKQKAEDEVRRIVGTKGHSDIQNIINRAVEKINGVQQTARVSELGDSSYNELEKFFNEFIKEFPVGTKFYSEKTIYDELNNEAGTLDLLAILPNGKAEIYDWKFVEFKQKDASGNILNKSVAWYKEENYNVQLTRYRQILRNNYGVSSFGKARVIPISATYKSNKLQSLEIGNKKIDGIDRPYLDPVPLTGLAKVELGIEETGDKQLDDLIEVLLQQRKKILDKVEYSAEGKIKKTERLERINNSIKRLQIEGDVKSFLDDAIFELNYITNVGIENLNNDDLVVAKALVDYYSGLMKHDIIPSSQSLKYSETLARVTLNAQNIYSKILSEYKARIISEAKKVGVEDPFKIQPETNMMSRLFRTISQSEHPMIKSLYKLVKNQKNKIYNDNKTLREKIQKSLVDLEKWGSSKGLKKTEIFRGILQFDENGKWNGKLINRWDPKYYSDKKDAISNKDYKWFEENVSFDDKKYEEFFQRNVKIWNDMYKNDKDSELKIERRIEEYKSKYDIRHSNSALLNANNRFIHPKEIWRSKEWTSLQSPENKQLKDFYDLFVSTINEFREYLPLDVNGNFIPNIKNDLIDQISENGLSSISGMGNSIINHLEASSDESVGMIDEITGEKVKSIPLLYTREIDSKSKSMDLGKVLMIFGDMAYNYKYMSEIESTTDMLRDVLSSPKQLITTSNGKVLRSKVTGKIASALGSSDTLENFNDFANFYLYGMKKKGKDMTFTFFGKELSAQKTFSSAMQYYSTKSLSGNLLSGLANGIGGSANAFFEGVKGRFYNNSQYSKSLALISSRNEKAFSAIEFFDIDSTDTNFKKANNLSVSKVVRNMTMDKFYFLQKGPDYLIENSVLLAMMQSHTIDSDGKIVKIKKDEKSLFDMAQVKDDKFSIENLSNEEFHKFRDKVKYLYGTIKGNTNPDDINSIKMTVLGQAVMQFRGWIPRMADERFGELRYTGDLETYEMGKYRSFWQNTVVGNWNEVGGKKGILPATQGMVTNLLTGLISGGVLGIGANSINSKSVTQKAIQLYNEAKAKNPDLKITQDEFVEMHKQNLRSTALELQLILVITGILMALKGDDDDDKDPLRMAAAKILRRNLSEISFFMDPESTSSILKKPIPILSFATDITGFIGDFAGETVGVITGDEKQMKKNRPVRKFNKIFPVTNALEGFWSLSDPDYNKSSK